MSGSVMLLGVYKLFAPTGDVDLLYLINGGAGMPVLERAYEKWLGETDLTIMYRLFAAQGGMADAEAGLAMWSLAELAYANDQTREQLLA